MPHTPQQVLAQLQQKQYSPVYLLQGEEPYYIDLITQYLETHVLSAAERSFNLTVVYGKDQPMEQILTQARRFPMGSTHQVVIVKEAQELPDLQKQAGRQLLERYVKAPQPTTLLVFAHKYKTLDARQSLTKTLAQHAVVVTTKKLYDHQLPDWIRAYVQEKKLNITEKALQMLQECVGNDLARQANELDKLRLNLAAGATIDEDVVQTYVGISKTYNAFELQRALARKDAYKAQQIAMHLAADPRSNPVIPLVALLFTFFSKLLLVHHAGAAASETDLAGLLRVRPYFIGEYVSAAKKYPLPQVIANIHYLHEADLQLKGVDCPATPEGEILKALIFRLTHAMDE